MLGYGLILLAMSVAGALAWLYRPDKQGAALEAEYAQPPSEFLDAAGVRLHVRDTGPRAAPAVIFLHGFGSSLQTWDDWARDLDTDHRVIRYDMPGIRPDRGGPVRRLHGCSRHRSSSGVDRPVGRGAGKCRRQLDGWADRLDFCCTASGAHG